MSAATTREPLLVRVPEAARLLACDRATIWRKVQAGELRAVGRGPATRITMTIYAHALEASMAEAVAGLGRELRRDAR